MKVLIISHMYPSSYNEVSGIFVHKQVRALVSKGIEVRVISPVPWAPFPTNQISYKWRAYSNIPKYSVVDGINVYYPRYVVLPRNLLFSYSGKTMYYGIREIVNEIYKDFEFDVIHANVALPDGVAGMEISKVFKKPLILTIHGQDFYYTIFRNRKCKSIVEEAINFSSRTIVVSDKLKMIGEQTLNVNSDKLCVIPNGIDMEGVFNGKSDLLEKYKDRRIILSVSYLIKRKGIDLNIKALAELKDKYQNLLYLIVGDGPERKNLEELAVKLNLQEHMKFLGMLPHNKVMEYMSICDVFSLPSWDEAFGVVYVEAMAHGKPVIACAGEGIDGIVKNRETGLLVRPHDVASLVEALEFLLSNPEKARAIGEEARKLVLENYTWEKNAEKTIEVYRKALNEH
jgi:glycosyltransferase involved in cell wall biosynthesis